MPFLVTRTGFRSRLQAKLPRPQIETILRLKLHEQKPPPNLRNLCKSLGFATGLMRLGGAS
jgi:hypothetical protein